MVIDDYFYWSGVAPRVDEFLAAHPTTTRRPTHTRLHIVRV
jgi:hypothetical protein